MPARWWTLEQRAQFRDYSPEEQARITANERAWYTTRVQVELWLDKLHLDQLEFEHLTEPTEEES